MALKSLKANCAWKILVEMMALVETIAKSQALQTAGQSDVLQALIEINHSQKPSFANCRAK